MDEDMGILNVALLAIDEEFIRRGLEIPKRAQETNAQKVARGVMQIIAEGHMRADPPRMVDADPFPGGVNLFAGGINWVFDGCGFDVELDPDSQSTQDLSRALEGSIAAGVWNGTSFGRK